LTKNEIHIRVNESRKKISGLFSEKNTEIKEIIKEIIIVIETTEESIIKPMQNE